MTEGTVPQRVGGAELSPDMQRVLAGMAPAPDTPDQPLRARSSRPESQGLPIRADRAGTV